MMKQGNMAVVVTHGSRKPGGSRVKPNRMKIGLKAKRENGSSMHSRKPGKQKKI